MNEFLSITDNGTIEAVAEKLEAIGEDRLISWVRWSLGEQSDEFVDYVRKTRLSGQSMKVLTGETRDHIGAWMQRKLRGKKESVFVIRPGKGIDGLQNYLERWTGTKHEFMRPAFAAFGAENRIARAVESNIEKMIRTVEYEK